MPDPFFGRSKAKVAEADPAEADAIHQALTEHEWIMSRGYELFNQVGHYKDESTKHAIALCHKGLPLIPQRRHKVTLGNHLGVYDNSQHQQYTSYLVHAAHEVCNHRRRLRRHLDALRRTEDHGQKEAEAARILNAMKKANEWCHQNERDTDGPELLEKLIAGQDVFKDESRRETELERLRQTLSQTHHDLSTIL